MELDHEILGEIVRRILGVTRAERIILFGSAASGNMNRDSDIDLLILKESLVPDGDEWLTIRRSLRGIGYPFDIVLMTTERFEESKKVIGGLAYPAAKYGRVIYEAA